MDLSAAETLKEKGVSVLQPQGSAPPATDKRAQMDGAAASPGAPRVPEELSILPIRGFVLFPGAVLPLTVSRPASIKLLDETLPITKVVGFLTQRDEQKEEPAPQDLYDVGTAAIVLKLLRQAEDQLVIVVQGLRRFAIRKIVAMQPYLRAEIDLAQSIVPEQSSEWQAEFQNLRDSATRLAQLRPDVPEEAAAVIRNIDDPEQLTDFLAPNLDIPVAQKQAILKELDVRKRLRAVQTHVSAQLEVAQIQQKLQEDVKSQFSDAQRKAYLRGQLKAIQRELGEGDTGADEQVARLPTRLEEAKPPADVMGQAERELKRLDIIPPASPEYSVIVSYVETIAELPWSKLSEDNLDLDKAQEILDRDHYDLEKVKRRLIEYLAVRKLNPQGHGPILCLVGPPGVGKTSLGHSVADALGRKFARLALGGMRDEAEIRGHRRTYVGALPGRIIQSLRRVESNNPVILLDEIDKVGSDFRGDPAAALLEVLDPQQNNTFTDNYLDLPFDLSPVLFITTANWLDPIHPALRDRLEVIELPSYTATEKLQIAKRYLVPRQLDEHGLKAKLVRLPDGTLKRLIHDYTREAGVRQLEREIAALTRKAARKIVSRHGLLRPLTISPDELGDYLGPARFESEMAEAISESGVATGLAWTPVGGDILFIEATRVSGTGKLLLTGSLGEVMKESAHTALTYLRSQAKTMKLEGNEFDKQDIHIHVPAGATPKDGPSAGVTIVVALASLLAQRRVRSDLAMTGEISLRGRVLPVGGIKEKVLAANRAGIKHIILPDQNRKDW